MTEIIACKNCIHHIFGFCHHPKVHVKSYTDWNNGKKVEVYPMTSDYRQNDTLCGRDGKWFDGGDPVTKFFNNLFS